MIGSDDDLNQLEIVLPWPHQFSSPNRVRGLPWYATQEAKVNGHKTGWVCALQALNRHPGGRAIEWPVRIPLSIRFFAPDRRRRDLDNLLASHKPMIDGIARALNVDDSRFRPVTIDDGQDQAGDGFVLVKLG